MKHLILPDSIKVIGVRAFEENASLEDITLPNTLESIGAAAFQYCYNLKGLMIPEGVKFIGNSAFWQSSFLRTLMLPESLEEIEEDAFYGVYKPLFFVNFRRSRCFDGFSLRRHRHHTHRERFTGLGIFGFYFRADIKIRRVERNRRTAEQILPRRRLDGRFGINDFGQRFVRHFGRKSKRAFVI